MKGYFALCLERSAADGDDPVFSSLVMSCNFGESALGQKIAMLLVTQEGGTEQRHNHAVEQAERAAAVGFGDQRECPAGF